VLATDSKPARIQVGTEDPIATGTISQAVGGVANSTSIQYRNTGRIVTIIPQVNSQGLVNLQILAEVSQRRSEPVLVGQDSFPAFDSRQAETTAVVQDGETLVIGGIITDAKIRSRVGVPFIMDLPVIGRFFSTTREEADRTELIMLITPKVIRNRGESRNVTQDFENGLSIIRNELERIRRDRERDLEKMKRQTPGQPKPAEPLAPSPVPAQPPANAPARPGAQLGPAAPPGRGAPRLLESSVGGAEGALPAETQDGMEAVLAAVDAVIESAKTEKPARVALPVETPSEEVNDPKAAPRRAEKSVATANKLTRVWVVQVAAFAQAQDADLLASRLRDKGYDVHVIAADVAGKTWHRVQVGELANRQEAFDLQKSLKSAEKLEQAFVTSR
jgi:cell division protein FtsN